MSDRADELIEAFYNKEEYLREAADYYPAESGSRRTLLEIGTLIAHFRDAVNEKPHGQVHCATHGVMFPKRTPEGAVQQCPLCLIAASPPHAAAEREKAIIAGGVDFVMN